MSGTFVGHDGYRIRKEAPVSDKIVAIGLLTQRDLDMLGSGFERAFSIQEDDAFADLVARLDRIPPVREPRNQHRSR